MKKHILYIIFLGLFALTFFSCKPKEVKDLDSFKKKYSIKTLEFKNSNELLTAFSELQNLFAIKFEEAKSIQELEGDTEFMELQLLGQSILVAQEMNFSEYKEKMDSISNTYRERISNAYMKLMLGSGNSQDFMPDEYISDGDSLNNPEEIK